MRRLCRVINVTRDMVLADRADVATNMWRRGKGLLGTGSLGPGQGLIIRPCQSVHTFFMAYPIDVLFIDRDRRVVHASHSLAPFRVSRLVWKAQSVIELPSGTLDRTGTQIGDVLTIEETS